MESVLVSIVLPIYNTDKQYLKEAIDSILRQTYRNFELLLIIDEEPSCGSKKFVESFLDERIIIIDNGTNKGLVYSLNIGIENAKGTYIFRMDSDDIAFEDRLEKQVKYLELHKEVDVLGTFADTFGMFEKRYYSNINNKQIRGELLWKNPLIHPTVAFRKSSVERYNVKYSVGDSEDYRLWLDLAFNSDCIFAVLPEVLLKYRIHPEQITNRDKDKIIRKDYEIVSIILKYCNVKLESKQIQLFCAIRNNIHINIKEAFEGIYILNSIKKGIPDRIIRKTFEIEYFKGLLKSLKWYVR